MRGIVSFAKQTPVDTPIMVAKHINSFHAYYAIYLENNRWGMEEKDNMALLAGRGEASSLSLAKQTPVDTPIMVDIHIDSFHA